MRTTPEPIRQFLAARRVAVAGVSRDPQQTANHIFRRLRGVTEVFAVNPRAEQVEGGPCYPSVDAVPGGVDAVLIVTPPEGALDTVRQCARAGVRQVWMHRSFGRGSVSDEAVRLCRELGIDVIVGACPLMYAEPVDVPHRCFRWMMGVTGRLPDAARS
jgi:hypothetical protein